MINLITGLPGNGKTLWTIAYIKAFAEKENRPVFYSGIKVTDPVALPWTEIDPEKWYECPHGAIIIIDECQRVFRPRANGILPPAHVKELETHRHLGHDLFLITQHPMLADNALRRLAGNHRHVVRVFGTQMATVHEWGAVNERCDKSSGREESIKHKWKYDKRVYNWYKSAEVHTVKRSVPMRVYLMFAIPLAIGACAYMAFSWFGKKVDKPKAPPGQMTDSVLPAGAVPTSPKVPDYMRAVELAREYTYERSPRMVGLAYTAPVYDEVTKPDTAPVPVACVDSKRGCTCYSQQATKLDVLPDMCKQFVAHGFFQDFGNKREDLPKQQNASYVASGAPVLSSAGQAVSMGDSDGYGLLGKRGAGVRDPHSQQANGPSPAKPDSQTTQGNSRPPSGRAP